MIDVDTHPALGKVPDMPVTCRHIIVASKKLLDGLDLCRGLHNYQIVFALSCCCHFYLLCIVVY